MSQGKYQARRYGCDRRPQSHEDQEKQKRFSCMEEMGLKHWLMILGGVALGALACFLRMPILPRFAAGVVGLAAMYYSAYWPVYADAIVSFRSKVSAAACAIGIVWIGAIAGEHDWLTKAAEIVIFVVFLTVSSMLLAQNSSQTVNKKHHGLVFRRERDMHILVEEGRPIFLLAGLDEIVEQPSEGGRQEGVIEVELGNGTGAKVKVAADVRPDPYNWNEDREQEYWHQGLEKVKHGVFDRLTKLYRRYARMCEDLKALKGNMPAITMAVRFEAVTDLVPHVDPAIVKKVGWHGAVNADGTVRHDQILAFYKEMAEELEEIFEEEKKHLSKLEHDLGFMFEDEGVITLDIIGSEAAEQALTVVDEVNNLAGAATKIREVGVEAFDRALVAAGKPGVNVERIAVTGLEAGGTLIVGGGGSALIAAADRAKKKGDNKKGGH